MDCRELNIVLRERARNLGLCNQWYAQWGECTSYQNLIDKYIKGIDFCIKHDYPKLDFIKAYVPTDILQRNGIFADEEVEADNLNTVVMLGNSNGVVRYMGQKSGNIYLRHGSRLSIMARNGARVFVETYDNTSLKVYADNISRVFVYQHGGRIEAEGNVVVRDKRKEGV